MCQYFLLNVISKLCLNADGSHNKQLYKLFLNEMQSMLEKSEREEVKNLKLKLNILNNMKINDNLINSILSHEIISYIAGFGLKKLMNHTGLKYKMYLNKVMHRYNLDSIKISQMPYNISYIKL